MNQKIRLGRKVWSWTTLVSYVVNNKIDIFSDGKRLKYYHIIDSCESEFNQWALVGYGVEINEDYQEVFEKFAHTGCGRRNSGRIGNDKVFTHQNIASKHYNLVLTCIKHLFVEFYLVMFLL